MCIVLTAELAPWRAVHVAYLGTDQPSLNLNFSKNANMVVAQYYQFLRLGFEGYPQDHEQPHEGVCPPGGGHPGHR